MPCTFLWDMTLRTNLGKSLETLQWYLECSSLLQFMAQEFPKTRVIHVFLHEMICTDMCLWYVSCFKKLYSSVLVCVKNELLLFSTCRLVVSFYDLLRTRNSERHWIIFFFPFLAFYQIVLYTSKVVPLPAWAAQSLPNASWIFCPPLSFS